MVRCWCGYLSGARCRLAYAQLMPLPLTVSCFSKIQIDFTFLVPAHPGSPGKRAVKRACVCVIVVLWPFFKTNLLSGSILGPLLLHVFQKITLGYWWGGFFTGQLYSLRHEKSVSQHRGDHSSLALTTSQALFILHPPLNSWHEGHRLTQGGY